MGITGSPVIALVALPMSMYQQGRIPVNIILVLLVKWFMAESVQDDTRLFNINYYIVRN